MPTRKVRQLGLPKTGFLREISHLGETLRWAQTAPLAVLEGFVSRASGAPLVSVGSGGSFTAATMVALLQDSTGASGFATTPLQLLQRCQSLRKSSVLLLTAGGKNPDILEAFRVTAANEPKQLLAVCMQSGSPLSRLASKYEYSSVAAYDLPTRRDGFLATNSLIATISLLTRAYASLQPSRYRTVDLSHVCATWSGIVRTQKNPSLARETFVVLHGGWGLPAAVDLESKLVEAALGRAILADYRHFAHGRHNWLAKRAAETTVIALVSPDECDIASKTLSLLPKDVPQEVLHTAVSGPWGALELVIRTMHLVAAIGLQRRVDPAKPGVPLFGRRIYHLRPQFVSAMHSSDARHSDRASVPIQRKLGDIPLASLSAVELTEWNGAYRSFMQQLGVAVFGAIIFDYDGTLCRPAERFSEPCQNVAKHLRRLLRARVQLGIVSGRGKSARKALQSIIPSEYWNNVLIGYYSGGDIATLDDPLHPDTQAAPSEDLRHLHGQLSSRPALLSQANVELRPRQLTVVPSPPVFSIFRSWLRSLVSSSFQPLRLFESDHSFDILPQGVSKVTMVSLITERLANTGAGRSILCIGDQGAWPGNDCELLATALSLSVNQVSADPGTCWNIARPGHRGVQAMLDYLSRMVASRRGFTFRTQGLA